MIPMPPGAVIATTVAQLDAEPQPTASTRGHWANELPPEVMTSVHWRGCDADRFFTIDEPTFAQLQATLTGPDASSKIGEFVRAIGLPDERGNITRDANGKPVYRNVDYVEATAWFGRLGTRGKAGAIYLWTDTFNVTDSMGEAMRGSRVRLA